MNWKKYVGALLGAAMCLALAACAAVNVPQEDLQPPEDGEEAGPAYWFEQVETSDKYSDDQGNLLASYQYQVLEMKTAADADETLVQAAANFNAGMREVLDNQLEIWRKGVEVSSIPVVIVILLLLAAFWLMLLLLLAGAAAGRSYRFTGPGLDAQGLNDLLARGTEFLRQQAALLHREFSGKHKGRGQGKQRRP